MPASCRNKSGELSTKSVLEMGGVRSKGLEARQFERYYFSTLATAIIRPLPVVGGEPQECFVMTRDLSRGGVSFLHPKRLAIGQRVELSFDDGHDVSASVRWVEKIEKRKFVIGCGFIKAGDNCPPIAPSADLAGE